MVQSHASCHWTSPDQRSRRAARARLPFERSVPLASGALQSAPAATVHGSRRGAFGKSYRLVGVAGRAVGSGSIAGGGMVLSQGTDTPWPQSQKMSVPAEFSGRPCAFPQLLQANQIMMPNALFVSLVS